VRHESREAGEHLLFDARLLEGIRKLDDVAADFSSLRGKAPFALRHFLGIALNVRNP
jgi:hypothetical protein